MSVDDPSEIEIGGIRLPRSDWEATPASVQALVATLLATIAQQQESLDHLTKQVVAMSERMAHFGQKPPDLRPQPSVDDETPLAA